MYNEKEADHALFYDRCGYSFPRVECGKRFCRKFRCCQVNISGIPLLAV